MIRNGIGGSIWSLVIVFGCFISNLVYKILMLIKNGQILKLLRKMADSYF